MTAASVALLEAKELKLRLDLLEEALAHDGGLDVAVGGERIRTTGEKPLR